MSPNVKNRDHLLLNLENIFFQILFCAVSEVAFNQLVINYGPNIDIIKFPIFSASVFFILQLILIG